MEMIKWGWWRVLLSYRVCFFGGLYHNRVANPGLLPAGREGNEILYLLRNAARDSFTCNQWGPLYSWCRLTCSNAWAFFVEIVLTFKCKVINPLPDLFLTDRWGPQLEQATYKNRQRLYLSEQARLLMLLKLPNAWVSSFYVFGIVMLYVSLSMLMYSVHGLLICSTIFYSDRWQCSKYSGHC